MSLTSSTSTQPSIVEDNVSTTSRAAISPPEPEPPQRRGGRGIERWMIERLLRTHGDPPISIILWDGEEISTCKEPPVARIHVDRRRTVWRVALDPYFQFSEAYSKGQLEIDGDLVAFLNTVNKTAYRRNGEDGDSGWLSNWLRRPRKNSLNGSKHNIHHHYDLGNDFYRLWLDEQLVYTCAYFADRVFSLEQAQIAKMDHVCRKVWMRPGETVFEAGCGWGALAIHMAQHYGVKVKAFNISSEQIAYARERAKSLGLSDRVEFIKDDWRNISGRCDAFMSVGMLEHVGVDNYAELGEVMNRCLPENGRGLIHTIGQNRPRPIDRWIERRIFPGSYPPALRELMHVFEKRDFSVLEVENLRLHYAETLKHWRLRFEQAIDTVRRMFDERFVRMWRLYLCGSQAGFETGGLQLFQVVFARGKTLMIPRTRARQHDEMPPDAADFFVAPRMEMDRCAPATS